MKLELLVDLEESMDKEINTNTHTNFKKYVWRFYSLLYLTNCLSLPVDGPNGEELIAEAIVSGKRKDAVVACALEACRILDKMGMLRNSKHGRYDTFLLAWYTS